MPAPLTLRCWLHPVVVWLLVLAGLFLTEYTVMLLLPLVLPEPHSAFVEAAVDAVTLIAVFAPVIWWTVVRPVQEVNRLRSHFVTNLLARIEADRRRTAHELHDGVGQTLSLLVSGLRSAHQALTSPEAADRCAGLLKLARTALQDVRRLSLGLRPSLLDDLGLAPALERLVADVREHLPIELSLDAADIAGSRFPESVETAVFRIVQEALANVVRHAGARTASVVVRRCNGALKVEVADDGRGIGRAGLRGGRPGHLGVVGMRERATLLGGQFAVDSAPGRGTRITAIIPAGGPSHG